MEGPVKRIVFFNFVIIKFEGYVGVIIAKNISAFNKKKVVRY